MQAIQSLNNSCFYKSMTTHKNYKIWQDVYHASFKGVFLYIKFQEDSEGYFTISFKELG